MQTILRTFMGVVFIFLSCIVAHSQVDMNDCVYNIVVSQVLNENAGGDVSPKRLSKLEDRWLDVQRTINAGFVKQSKQSDGSVTYKATYNKRSSCYCGLHSLPRNNMPMEEVSVNIKDDIISITYVDRTPKAADFDSRGDRKDPPDVYTCHTGTRNLKRNICIYGSSSGTYFDSPVSIKVSCHHAGQVLGAGTRNVASSSPSAHGGRSITHDYFPCHFFTHTRTDVYNIKTMSKTMGISKKHFLFLMANNLLGFLYASESSDEILYNGSHFFDMQTIAILALQRMGVSFAEMERMNGIFSNNASAIMKKYRDKANISPHVFDVDFYKGSNKIQWVNKHTSKLFLQSDTLLYFARTMPFYAAPFSGFVRNFGNNLRMAIKYVNKLFEDGEISADQYYFFIIEMLEKYYSITKDAAPSEAGLVHGELLEEAIRYCNNSKNIFLALRLIDKLAEVKYPSSNNSAGEGNPEFFYNFKNSFESKLDFYRSGAYSRKRVNTTSTAKPALNGKDLFYYSAP